MAENDFLNSEYFKKFILFDLFDVDEFVLREIESIKKSVPPEVIDVSNAKRISYKYEINQVGTYEKHEISNEEYIELRELGDTSCLTGLNYNEFEKEFPLQELDLWYGDSWLYDFHQNEGFFQTVVDWIDKTSGDNSKELRLRSLLQKIYLSTQVLNNIVTKKESNEELNKIQKKIIEIHLRFNNAMSEFISSFYSTYFPNLFENALKKHGHWHSIARLMANGIIEINAQGKYLYLGKEVETETKMCNLVSKHLNGSIKPQSIKPYLSKTKNPKSRLSHNKNIFILSRIEELKLIAKKASADNKVSEFFAEKLKELIANSN